MQPVARLAVCANWPIIGVKVRFSSLTALLNTEMRKNWYYIDLNEKYRIVVREFDI